MTSATDTMVLKFREVLTATERLGSAELRLYQENLLRPLLAHAQRNVPFYGQRLEPVFRGGEVDLSGWADIPLLTRAEAQMQTQALTASALPPHVGAVSSGETSGSTGRPVRYRKNELASIAELALTDRLHRWWGMDGNKTLAMQAPMASRPAPAPDGLELGAWRSGFPLGRSLALDKTANADELLSWLLARKPDYFMAYPSSFLALAERVRVRRAELEFELMLSTGSELSQETRSLCKTVFGARIANAYGANEVGQIACGCPHCDGLHVNSETLLVEILQPDGTPCGPGETGRVVATSFYNYAMPFIRYETGDMATLAVSNSRCAVALPRLSAVVGRYRNVFTLADGRIVFPVIDFETLRRLVPGEQFQIVQTSHDHILLRYVAQSASGTADIAGLQAYVRKAIDPGLIVTASAVDTIDRSASGKFEDYLSLVPLGSSQSKT